VLFLIACEADRVTVVGFAFKRLIFCRFKAHEETLAFSRYLTKSGCFKELRVDRLDVLAFMDLVRLSSVSLSTQDSGGIICHFEEKSWAPQSSAARTSGSMWSRSRTAFVTGKRRRLYQ
jgi:hypothetical protein